jgi:hypothetical protein
MPDLWPADFGQLDITPPLVILREQAAIITGKTRQRIVGQVNTTQHNGGFAHDFVLLAPYLDNYSYRLFVATHDVMLYPVVIHADVNNMKYDCTTSDQLTAVLRQIFGDPQTKKVINSLLAQTDSAATT